MGQLFIKVLNLSIVAGWLVLAIVVLRAVFRKVPKWIYCSLWALVGLRLIFPFSLQSMFSVIPSAETVPQDIVYSKTPEIHTGLAIANSYINPVIKDTFSPEIGDSVNPLQVWMEVIGIVWLIGIAGMLMFAFVSYLKLRKKTSASIILHNEAIDFEKNAGNGNFRCKKEIPYPVYACDDIDSPFILGLFRPKIFIPSDMDRVNLNSVYSHEMAHIQRKDFLWKPLGFLILTVYWFNPLMWVAYILLCRDIEGASDEKVINSMDGEGRVAYSQALLNCGTHTRKFSVCPLSFGETGVKSRVKLVLNYKKPAFWIIVMSLIACVVIGICFLTDPKDNVKGAGVDNGNDNTSTLDEDVTTNKYAALISDYYANENNILGMNYTDVHEKYGEPTGCLSGFFGDIYDYGNGSLILYYDRSTQTVNYIKKNVSTGNTGYDIFKSVLSGKEQFCYVDEGNKKMVSVDDVPSLFTPGDSYTKIWRYAFCDLDFDGVEEAILEIYGVAGDSGGKLILHRMNDEIYGYRTNYRTLLNLKDDGTYQYSAWVLTDEGYARITSFSEDGFAEDKFSYAKGDYEGADTFVVQHESATEGAFLEESKKQKSKIDESWFEYTREFFEELNPTTSPVMETVSPVSEIDADGKLIYSYSTDLSEDENNIRGKVYIWNDEGGDNHNNLLNNILMLRLYSDGKATYSQPIYSSHAPFNVTWKTENNIIVIKEGSQVNYFDIADGGLKFRKEGSSGFMFYDIPDGAFFKWEYNLTDAKAENS